MIAPTEIRDVPGHAPLRADNEGRVWRTNKPLKPYTSSHGDTWVYEDPHSVYRRPVWVKDAVCMAFHGPRPSDAHRVRHIDGDRSNTRPENLEWYVPKPRGTR